MKWIKLFLWFILLFLFLSCHSQKLVKTEKDSYKIKENEKSFIGKPLKDLLKQITPKINMVVAESNNGIHTRGNYFRFNFVDIKQSNTLKINGKQPISIIVYVKEFFDWDFQKRLKGKESIWTKEDEEKYGNLTVTGFRVYGDAIK